jgi:hypothetical protein
MQDAQGVVDEVNISPSARATTIAIPRSMTWCRAPGASSHGWRGIGGSPSVRGGFSPSCSCSASSTTYYDSWSAERQALATLRLRRVLLHALVG